MYRLATADVWWRIAREHPEQVPAHGQILKPLGHANVLNFYAQTQPRRVLEIGHGASSFTLDAIHDKAECWGIDTYDQEQTVPPEALERFRQRYPTVVFINGLVGSGATKLPNDQFDLVFSVSVVEHIPEDQVSSFYREIFRVLRPGGVMLHSYDVWWERRGITESGVRRG